MQRHESYKPSGVDWLERLPSHWRVLANRALFHERKDAGEEGLPILSVSLHTGVSDDEQNEEENARVKSRIAERSSYKRVRPGDVVYNMMRAWQGAIGAVRSDGLVSPAYVVAVPNATLNPAYFEYLYRTQRLIGEMDRLSKGITDFRKRLYWQEFKELSTLVPPIDEQDRIVSFLDQKTTEIDTAIAKKVRLMELLHEQKNILINNAVTCGLNPDIATRETGVAGFGKAPLHWPTVRFKHCFSEIKDGLHHTPLKHSLGANFVSTQHVKNRQINTDEASKISLKDYRLGHPRVRPEAGDVLITLVGSIGFAAIIEKNHLPLSCTRHVGYVRPLEEKINRDFLLYYTESPTFGSFIDQNVSRTAQPSIYLSSLANHKMVLPPLKEQKQIVDWLDQHLGLYERVFKTAKKHISLLQSMKMTLISDVITGKVRV